MHCFHVNSRYYIIYLLPVFKSSAISLWSRWFYFQNYFVYLSLTAIRSVWETELIMFLHRRKVCLFCQLMNFFIMCVYIIGYFVENANLLTVNLFKFLSFFKHLIFYWGIFMIWSVVGYIYIDFHDSKSKYRYLFMRNEKSKRLKVGKRLKWFSLYFPLAYSNTWN